MRAFGAVCLLWLAVCRAENATKGVVEEGIVPAVVPGFVPGVVPAGVVAERVVHRVGKENFTKYANRTSIDLSNMGLQEIEKDSFTEIDNLEELNLSFNPDLHILLNESFLVSKSLKHLNLSHVNIEELSTNIFEEIPNLETLDLSGTDVQNFSALSSLHNLKNLTISALTFIDNLLICNETNLQIIIEIENQTQNTYNCSSETFEQDEETDQTEETNDSIEEHTVIIETTTLTENAEIIENSTTKPISTPVESENKTEASSASPEKPPENIQQSSENTSQPTIPKVSETLVEIFRKLETTSVSADGTTDTEINTKVSVVEGPAMRNLNASEKIQQPPPAENYENEKKDKSENEKIEIGAEASQPSPSQSSGTNIVLGIILCVMIVGAVGFGYRYWKNKRQGYSNPNVEGVEDVEFGKELQDMSSRPIVNGEQN